MIYVLIRVRGPGFELPTLVSTGFPIDPQQTPAPSLAFHTSVIFPFLKLSLFLVPENWASASPQTEYDATRFKVASACFQQIQGKAEETESSSCMCYLPSAQSEM